MSALEYCDVQYKNTEVLIGPSLRDGDPVPIGVFTLNGPWVECHTHRYTGNSPWEEGKQQQKAVGKQWGLGRFG